MSCKVTDNHAVEDDHLTPDGYLVDPFLHTCCFFAAVSDSRKILIHPVSKNSCNCREVLQYI